MANHTLRTYLKGHKFDHPTDVERGKVSRDTHASLKKEKRQERLCRQVLADPLADDLIEQLEAAEHAAERGRRGAKTHKDRLKQLEREGLQ